MIRANRHRAGFTLVELLIVVAIIGILAAIAIPQMSYYRTRAVCGSMEADLGQWAKAQELYFVNAQAYTTSAVNDNPPGFRLSPGVVLTPGAITNTRYIATATHPQCVDINGAAVTYTYDSTGGGLIK